MIDTSEVIEFNRCYSGICLTAFLTRTDMSCTYAWHRLSYVAISVGTRERLREWLEIIEKQSENLIAELSSVSKTFGH